METSVYRPLIEELATGPDKDFYREVKLKDSEPGRRVLALSPEEQCRFVFESLAWIYDRTRIATEAAEGGRDAPFDYRETMVVRWSVDALLRRKLPFDHDGILHLLEYYFARNRYLAISEPPVTKQIETYLAANEPSPELLAKVGRYVTLVESEYTSDKRAMRKRMTRLKETSGLVEDGIPLTEGEVWSDRAISDVEGNPPGVRAAWKALLDLCVTSGGSRPGEKWRKSADARLREIGYEEFRSSVLTWFSLVDAGRSRGVERTNQWQPDPNLMMDDRNADVLKGLVWLCADTEDREMARALATVALSAYRKVPQIGPRCVRVGNACVLSLGDMPGTEAIGQLAVIKARVKFGTALKGIESALDDIAAREGLPREDIEEMSVPSYGLQSVGVRTERFGEFTAELVVTGTSSTELRWFRSDGKQQKSVPKRVREEYSEELKGLRGDAKDIQKLLVSQRDRIESFYLDEKFSTYPEWCDRYLDHPLVGTLARRLVWVFSRGERSTTGVWNEGGLHDVRGDAFDWPDADTTVELWHPLRSSTDEILAWRERLSVMGIRQPFKQAHREVYILTDAERRTETYSNRFAAHILKQHQFNALCASRGWQNSLRLMVDDFYGPASRHLPKYGMRAEYWIEAVGQEYGTDTTESGVYLYIATDQVRFYPEEVPENYAHAGGGGYTGPPRRRWFGRLDHTPTTAIPLTDVPPLVFSEVMRDADLFVGVSSVGNDPTWYDGGPAGRHRDYWTSYSFGDLTESAKTRKAVVEQVLPRLRIADRCTVSDRFLIVRGELRTYRIHLGSGNILMEPDDRYLCIVPSSGGGGPTDKVFLPFEGDRTLAIILSKAFMLAEDGKITDSSIVRQIVTDSPQA